jgi:hypothetical protein
MHEVIDGLKKIYIIISDNDLEKSRPGSGPRAIAFGFGIGDILPRALKS